MKHIRWILLFALVLTIGLGLLFAEQLVGVYRSASFGWGERTEVEIRVKEYADSRDIPYGDYPPSLIELLERNPETEEFVLGYPFRQDVEIDLGEYNPADGVPLFLQWDQRWGYQKYGSDFLAVTGCGPTCLAMAGYYVTGDARFTPDKIAQFSERNGYYASGYGSSWTLISEGGVKLGLDVTEIPLVEKRIVDNLEVGNPIICAMGAGDFTTTGHYIVLAGLEDGKYRVNDPNSLIKSGQLWSYEQIEDQIRNLWVIRYFG